MFSALKKLVGSEQAPGRDKNIPAGLQSMNQALQRRFAKGVQYNSECRPGALGSCQGTWKGGSEGTGGGGRCPAGSAGPGFGDWDLAETRALSRPQGLAVCGEMWQILLLRVRCAEPLPVAGTLGVFTWAREVMSGGDARLETRSWRTQGAGVGAPGPVAFPSDRWVIPEEYGHVKKSVRFVCTVKFVQAVPGAFCGALIGPDNLVQE